RLINNMSEAKPEFLAAIDLGSNSFHMKIARVEPSGRLRTIDRMREMVQLASGLDEQSILAQDTIDRALDCLQRFGQRLTDIPASNVRAVGTNTLRKARNAGKFLQQADAVLGRQIEIISGYEEARLVYLGVAHSVQTDAQKRLVIDIGGGSTELIVGTGFTPLQKQSLYMGCVSMSRKFFPDGRISKKRMRAAELFALRELEWLRAAYRSSGWEVAIGSSGTIRAISNIIRQQGWHDHLITAEALDKLGALLIELGDSKKINIDGIEQRRANVLPGGVAILKAAFSSLEIKEMTTSEGALREGLLYDMLGRISNADVRNETVIDLGERYHVGELQAKRVEASAQILHQQVAKAWRLRDSYHKKLLNWAAYLHEIGLDIAHAQYHKHGAYLIQHADLPGFSRQEQTTLAALVRSHRRKFHNELFDVLREKAARKAKRLTVLLRLAVLLNRSRLDNHPSELTLSVDSENLLLQFPANWLAEHPLTQADLEQETNYLKSAGFKLSVE
ncbi:MAG: exopolyphosphatase, partial [Pseudomonadales bacterium]